ncbi:hypothetical protein, partial [Escherichia coli]|uniref:hypothetical protein n=1 Tax=Escherichia coli TaxID=562 RepID=UPI001F04C34D
SPGGALISLGRGIGILALRLSGLPALWGMVSGAVGALAGALGGIGGWRVLFAGITSGAGRFAALLGVVAGRLRGVQAGLGAL